MAKAKKAKPKAPRGPAKPEPRAAKGKAGDSGVEKRWREYWKCRKELEDAVEKVRAAREALNGALDAERSRREAFEDVKRTLTDLLDVEPAGPRLLTAASEQKSN